MKKLLAIILVTFIAGSAFGAASQYRYKVIKYFKVAITGAQAATGLSWFEARGAWDGSPASQVSHCCITRTGESDEFPDGLAAECRSLPLEGTVPADSLPDGAQVLEVIN